MIFRREGFHFHWPKIFPLQTLSEATDPPSFSTETRVIPPPLPSTPGDKYWLVTDGVKQTNNSFSGPWPGSTVTESKTKRGNRSGVKKWGTLGSGWVRSTKIDTSP